MADFEGIDVTEKEKMLLSEARKLEEREEPGSQPAGARMEEIARRHIAFGEKVYRVTVPVTVDDDTELEYTYLFTRPKTQSYDRYVKTINSSVTKASRAFVMDNVVEELREKLREDLDEYPAMAVNISGKLLAMLGLADSISVKKL